MGYLARTRLYPWVAGLGVAVVMAPSVARACGGFLFENHEERPGGMSAQEIFLGFGEDSTTLVVSAGYTEPGGAMAFLLPIAVAPDEVLDGDMALFVALEAGTEPVVDIIDSEPSSGGGCSPGPNTRGDLAGGGGEQLGGGEDVVVVDRGATETYEYVIVGGSTGTALADWLASEGFAVPDSFAGVSQSYVDEGWLFLAARVSPDVDQGSLAPLELRFPAGPATAGAIPFGIGAESLAQDKRLSITLYLAGDEMLLPGNYAHTTIEPAALRAVDESTSNYGELFDAATQSDAQGAWVIEYSREGWDPAALGDWLASGQEQGTLPEGVEYDPAYLEELAARLGLANARFTRLRTALEPSQLRDMTLEVSAAIDVSRDFAVYRAADLGGGASLPEGVLLLGALPLLGLPRRRRRGR